MLATGGSTCMAIDQLKKSGAREEQIVLVSAIGAPEGMAYLKKNAPGVRVVIAQMDEKLNANYFICPGLGDFGDRYFGTT
jgi:uracil phosphoribosyltransferase